MIRFLDSYWFRVAPCFDLAIVRIISCFVAFFITIIFNNYPGKIAELSALPDAVYQPVFLLKLLHAPFGWGYDESGAWGFRPSGEFVLAMFWVFLISGVLSLIGLLSRISLLLFAATFIYVQAYIYSFGDFHHSQAIMAVMLAALALSPSARVLSLDSWLRRRHKNSDWPDATSIFASWPLLLIQWFFVLMYWSAVFSKLSDGGLDWPNGYTLQYYLARDGLRWGGEFALWLSQWHYLILLGQIGVLVYQITFFLAVIYAPLRWLYVPAGIFLHSFIYITLQAPFFTWIALFAVFIPWYKTMRWIGNRKRPGYSMASTR